MRQCSSSPEWHARQESCENAPPMSLLRRALGDDISNARFKYVWQSTCAITLHKLCCKDSGAQRERSKRSFMQITRVSAFRQSVGDSSRNWLEFGKNSLEVAYKWLMSLRASSADNSS